jgi:hypothetical protein
MALCSRGGDGRNAVTDDCIHGMVLQSNAVNPDW